MSTPVGISGSRAAAILGLSPYNTLLQVWLDIIFKIYPEFVNKNYDYEPFTGNTATKWGHKFENAIIKLTEQKFNTPLKDREKFFQHPEYDFITCHVDAISENGILIENKTTSLFSFNDQWGEPSSDKIPLQYQIQVQHNLMTTGLLDCVIPVLVFPDRPEKYEEIGVDIDKMSEERVETWASVLNEMGCFHTYKVKSNYKMQELMLKRYQEFWQVNILGRQVPKPVNVDDIKRIYIEPKGTIIATDTLETLAMEYQQIQQEIGKSGALAKRQEQLKFYILDEMRKMDAVIDDESREKTVLRNKQGQKILQYGKKGGFRVC